MSKNYDNIRVYGDLESEIFLAPKGTVLPEDFEDPTTPFRGMGWLSEDGIDLEVEAEVEKFRGWQGGTTVRTKVTSTDKTFTAQFLEETPGTTSIFYGYDEDNDVTINGDYAKVDLPESIGTVARTAVIKFKDGDVTKYLCCEEIQAGERGTVSHKNDDMTIYEITFTIVGKSFILSNAESFVGSSS